MRIHTTRLCALSILVVLAALSVAMMNRETSSMASKVRIAETRSTLKDIGTAVHSFRRLHGGRLPAAKDAGQFIEVLADALPLTPLPTIVDSRTGKVLGVARNNGMPNGVHLYLGSPADVIVNSNSSAAILYSSKVAFPRGLLAIQSKRCIVFSDGAVGWVDAQ